jgi:hypothetical protein
MTGSDLSPLLSMVSDGFNTFPVVTGDDTEWPLATNSCETISEAWKGIFPNAARNPIKFVLVQVELVKRFSAVRSRVACPAIDLTADHPACLRRKAKPNPNTRTLRSDKCLVVKSLDSSLRPCLPRNPESIAITTRAMKASKWSAFRVSLLAARCRGVGRNQTVLLLALRRRDGRQSFSRALARAVSALVVGDSTDSLH